MPFAFAYGVPLFYYAGHAVYCLCAVYVSTDGEFGRGDGFVSDVFSTFASTNDFLPFSYANMSFPFFGAFGH